MKLQHPAICVLASWLAISTAPAQAPGAPVFRTGDLADLGVKIVEAREASEPLTILVVEVTNRGAVDAEPLAFRIETRDKQAVQPSAVFHRAGLPRMQRYGRPTPAGGKQTYSLVTNLPGKRAQFSVAVTAASWHENGVVPRPELVIGKPTQVQRESLVGIFPVTQVDVRNPFDCDVDLVFAVTMTQPRDSVDLFGLRLAAGATRTWVIGTLPGADCYTDVDTPPGCAMRAKSFELVDWCLVGDSDPAAAADALRPAYEGWLRWPDAEAEVSGRFTFRERRRDTADPEAFISHAVAGRFTMPKRGAVVIEILTGTGANASQAITEAIGNLRRPAFADIVAKNTLRHVEADRVQVKGPGWEMSMNNGDAVTTGGGGETVSTAPDYRIRDGRIVSAFFAGDWETAWETRDVDDGYVVTRQRSDSYDKTFTYQQLDGRIVPSGSTQTVKFGERLFSTQELQLTDLRFDGGSRLTHAAPAGEGVAALRTIWDATYRLPSEPIKVSASFEVQQNGTDWVWRLQKKIRGKLTMVGVGRHTQDMHFEFDGNLSPEIEVGLAEAFRDRLGMWYPRDFNDRADFDETFADATIQPAKADGSFEVTGCHIAKVLTEDGIVRALVSAGGDTTRFTYQKFGDRMAVTRIELSAAARRGERAAKPAVVTITLASVGEYLLPTKLLIERNFGDDWGPETLVMKNLKIE